jgi:hypothetical protein
MNAVLKGCLYHSCRNIFHAAFLLVVICFACWKRAFLGVRLFHEIHIQVLGISRILTSFAPASY